MHQSLMLQVLAWGISYTQHEFLLEPAFIEIIIMSLKYDQAAYRFKKSQKAELTHCYKVKEDDIGFWYTLTEQ